MSCINSFNFSNKISIDNSVEKLWWVKCSTESWMEIFLFFIISNQFEIALVIDKLVRIVTEMNKKRTELEKDAAMQRKKKMFLCIILCLHSQHCYIHFISTEGEKLGYVFYSTVTEFSNCLTILTNLLTIIFSILFDRWLKQSLWYLDIPPQSYAWRNQA